MTIAIGLSANEGVLLCADMQKTIGDMKTYDGKIVETIFHNENRLTLAVAGAGYEDYIKTAREALTSDFPESIRADTLKHELKSRLIAFWREHLLPWPERERPDVELLIGVTGLQIPPRLFHYQGTAFSEVDKKAIGCGVLLAADLLNSYCRATYSLEQLARIAIFIVSKVKAGVEGCGGPTHLTTLRANADFGFCNFKDICFLEEKLQKLESDLDREIADRVTATGAETKIISWISEAGKKLKP